MNRPKLQINNESIYQTIKRTISYYEELEKYCGCLEKALDKACEQLAMNEEVISFTNEYHDKKMWKYRFLNVGKNGN